MSHRMTYAYDKEHALAERKKAIDISDEIGGYIMQEMSKDTTFIMFSDHG
jgi:hypothetical protein